MFIESEKNRFTGSIRHGSFRGDSAVVLGGSDIGLEFKGASDDLSSGGASDARWFKELDLSRSFVGNVVLDDVVNGSDEAGFLANGAAPLDWIAFESPFRAWSRGFESFGMREGQGVCQTVRGGRVCRIQDWSLHSMDRQLLGQLTLPSESPKRLLARAWAAGDAIAGERSDFSCGLSAAAASQVLVTQSSGGGGESGQSVQSYLAAAVEQLNDEVGDGDGLCESGERCIVLPQQGADLGFGELKTCAERGVRGSLFDVELQRYEWNGR
jgi:hypothetical protein